MERHGQGLCSGIFLASRLFDAVENVLREVLGTGSAQLL